MDIVIGVRFYPVGSKVKRRNKWRARIDPWETSASTENGQRSTGGGCTNSGRSI